MVRVVVWWASHWHRYKTPPRAEESTDVLEKRKSEKRRRSRGKSRRSGSDGRKSRDSRSSIASAANNRSDDHARGSGGSARRASSDGNQNVESGQLQFTLTEQQITYGMGFAGVTLMMISAILICFFFVEITVLVAPRPRTIAIPCRNPSNALQFKTLQWKN